MCHWFTGNSSLPSQSKKKWIYPPLTWHQTSSVQARVFLRTPGNEEEECPWGAAFQAGGWTCHPSCPWEPWPKMNKTQKDPQRFCCSGSEQRVPGTIWVGWWKSWSCWKINKCQSQEEWSDPEGKWEAATWWAEGVEQQWDDSPVVRMVCGVCEMLVWQQSWV